ncbi:hypothetical protein [Brevibacillus marinus]|uniref:hypothetical protein n=1 Tax=Brevibacillus marinus TaxID=2496837 RepID=UPI000F83EF5A|nr:hypothetical protein [Brevibacillus marinus]
MSKKKNVNSFGYVIDPYKPVERPYGQSYSNIDVNGYVIDPSKPVYESSSAWDDEDDYEYAESSSEPGFLTKVLGIVFAPVIFALLMAIPAIILSISLRHFRL